MINVIESTFFALLRIGISGKEEELPEMNCSEWNEIYNMAIKQSVGAIIANAIEFLAQSRRPNRAMLLQFISLKLTVEQQNRRMTNRCVELQQMLMNNGFRSCIIKGQGNAEMYRDVYMRSPGDIDCWIEGSRIEIYRFIMEQCSKILGLSLKETTRNIHNQYHHIDFPFFQDTEVEIHYTPAFMFNPYYNHRIQDYVEKEKNRQLGHQIATTVGQVINVPTNDFNIVFQLSHVFKHYITEGIGARHAVDYYYLLLQSSAEERMVAVKVLKSLRLSKFTRGWMWIMKTSLGLKDEYLLGEPDIRIGKQIYEDMICGGNFGHSNEQHHFFKNNKYNTLSNEIIRSLFLTKEYPTEAIARPYNIVWHQVWKVWFKLNNRVC